MKLSRTRIKLLQHESLTPIESGITLSQILNSKLIKLKKNFKKFRSKNQNIDKARKNEKFAWCSIENFQLTEASQLVSTKKQ